MLDDRQRHGARIDERVYPLLDEDEKPIVQVNPHLLDNRLEIILAASFDSASPKGVR